MADKKKTQQWVTVAALVGIALLLVYLWRNRATSKDVEYPPLAEAPATDYLTYNQPPLIPEVGNVIIPPQAPINLGDVNVTVGGGGSNNNGGGWSPCRSGFQFVVPPINTGINTPTLTPPPDTYTPSDYETIDVGRYIADCSIQTIQREVKEISEYIGVTTDEIYNESFFLRRDSANRGWMNANAPMMEPGLYDMNSLTYSVYYDPDEDKGMHGKRVRLTPRHICECKRGRKQYCGRYLTPDMFKDVYQRKAS